MRTGGQLLRWPCNHVSHILCVGARCPMPCPMCRQPWSQATTETYQWILGFPPVQLLHGVDCDDLEAGAAGDAAVEAPPALPVDVLFRCCRHLGPPPDFREMPERCMRYSCIGGTDSWQCMRCFHEVSRTPVLQHHLEFHEEYQSRWCEEHEAYRTLTFNFTDMVLSSSGLACVTVCGDHLSEVYHAPRTPPEVYHASRTPPEVYPLLHAYADAVPIVVPAGPIVVDDSDSELDDIRRIYDINTQAELDGFIIDDGMGLE